MKKFYILTIGCQMNKSDSERLAAFLEQLNLKAVFQEEGADILVINACSVRQSAIDRVHGKAKKWNKWKKKKKIITILTGCVLPADKKQFVKKFDLVAGIGEYGEIKKIIKQKIIRPSPVKGLRPLRDRPNQKIKKSKNQKVDLEEFDDYLKVTPHYHSKFAAFVPIMTGCNNFCAYCAVPYVRGRERSRSVKEVLQEVKNLAKRGYLEITLLGQNVNSYLPTPSGRRQASLTKDGFSKNNIYKHPFAALLWEINQIEKLQRIFFTAPHPKDMADEVIDALALPKMVNYLHLPVQSGDNEILKKMNRHYTVKDYLKLIKKIKKKRPGIAIGTDIIVGFPGETKKQFQNTVKLYQEVEFDISYTAKYSPRSGTPAAKLKDNVSLAEKKRRWQTMQKLMEKITLKKNKKYESKIVSVLVDKFTNGKCEGNSSEMKRVEFKGSKNLIGQIVDVKIIKALTWILRGALV